MRSTPSPAPAARAPPAPPRAHARRRPPRLLQRPPAGRAGGGIREIPLDAISGTLEPSRARQFDGGFRPVRGSARRRWESIWIAEERGVTLPPISVVAVGDRYAVRDGHHRVSVARARGAVAIDAVVA